MAKEIELKLSLPKLLRQKFLRLPLLLQATSRQAQTLTNRYYDTPSLDLQKNGVALRTRQQGRRWLQTVKCAGSSIGGLSSRPEWETDYRGNFDFSSVDAPAVRDLLDQPGIKDRLTVLFETRFQRTTWRFEPRPGCSLLLMLDHGEITAAGHHEKICEVEIELVGPASPASLDAIFSLARALATSIPLLPTSQSKAERGYRLFFGTPLRPRKAKTPHIDPCTSPTRAYQAVMQECLDHLQTNHEGVLGSDDPEFIHQMRVATRRMRSARHLFSPWICDNHPPETRLPPNQLSNQLGAVRDLDVLLEEIILPACLHLPETPSLTNLRAQIEQQRQQARQSVQHYLQSPDHARFMLQMAQHLQQDSSGPPRKDAGKTASRPLAKHLRPRLKHLLKKTRHLADATQCHDPDSLHHLRIAIKRLRHALEFSASYLEPQSLARLLEQLAALQEDIGQINDLHHAGPLLLRYARKNPERLAAIAAIGQYHTERYRTLQAGLPGKLRPIQHAKCPKPRGHQTQDEQGSNIAESAE